MILLLPYHSDVFPDAQGEYNVYPQPGLALDEILQGVYQCKKVSLWRGIMDLSPPKSQNCTQFRTWWLWVTFPLLELLNCDVGKNFALIGNVHTSWQIETAAGFRLTRYSWIFFFYIQKSKFHSVSCSVPFRRYATITITVCVSFLSKRVLKLEPGTWCLAVCRFQGLALRAGSWALTHLRGLSPDPRLISECKEIFLLLLFLFCSVFCF